MFDVKGKDKREVRQFATLIGLDSSSLLFLPFILGILHLMREGYQMQLQTFLKRTKKSCMSLSLVK